MVIQPGKKWTSFVMLKIQSWTWSFHNKPLMLLRSTGPRNQNPWPSSCWRESRRESTISRGYLYETSARVYSFLFFLSHNPPLSSPFLSPPLLISRQQQCCMGVTICLQGAITQQFLLHIFPDKCACMQTIKVLMHMNTGRTIAEQHKYGYKGASVKSTIRA